jgi:hypothetical protein
LKLEAGIVSCTKSYNSLTNALVKHEAEHMPDIFEMRGVTWSYKPEVVFASSKLNVVYYQAKIYGDACGSSLVYTC